MRIQPVRGRSQKPARWLTKSSLFIWLVLASALLLFIGYGWLHSSSVTEIDYGKLLQILDDPHVTFTYVHVSPTQITGQLQRLGAPAQAFVTSRAGLENDPNLVPLLRKRLGAHFGAQAEESSFKAIGLSMLPPLFVTLLLGGVLFWAFRRAGGSLLP